MKRKGRGKEGEDDMHEGRRKKVRGKRGRRKEESGRRN